MITVQNDLQAEDRRAGSSLLSFSAMVFSGVGPWVREPVAGPCQPVLCPAHHYCPEGSAEPLLCPPGHVCKGQDLEALVNGTWGDLVPLAAGISHTVVVSNLGHIWAAGENDNGQLGTGSTVEQHAFLQVAFDGKKIVAVAAGKWHTAAITDSGELWTWGRNGDGRFGIRDTTDRHAPVKVSVNGQKIVAVAAGGHHTAAITDSRELWTWGWNGYGQLGVGDTTDRHAPVKVSVNGQKIVALAAGYYHTAAITDSGELVTWGSNGLSQLGIGDTTDRHAPVKVSVNGQKFVAVAAGYWHTAAITDSGELWTWGHNDYGQLGVGDTMNRHVPVKVSVNGQKIVAVAAGGHHTAAITDSGELWTWGRNGYGQLGVGDTTDRHAPVKVSVNGQKIVALAAGYYHTAAITDSGELWTWGYNRNGRLGIGDTKHRHSPVKAALPVKIGEMRDPPCWSLEGRASSVLGEAFLAATWGSEIPQPRQCSALRGQLATFQQERRVQVGAWEATPCTAGSFCAVERVALCSAGLLEGGGAEGSKAPTPCKAGVWCPAGSVGPPGSKGPDSEAVSAGDPHGSAQPGGSTESREAVQEICQIEVAKMQQQERALSALQAKVAELEKQQLQSDATVQAQQLQQAAVETSIRNLEVKAQIWASHDYKKLEDQLQQAAAKKQDMDETRHEFASRIAKVEQQWQQAAVDEKVPQQHLRACAQSLEATVQTLKSADDEQLQQASTDNASQPIEGGGDTAVDFRGTEALGIWRGLTIVSALAAGSILFGIRMLGNSQVTQYSHAGRRVLKIRSPNISIHDVCIRHSGLRVEVDLGHRATKPRLVRAQLRSTGFEAFEFRHSETVMEDGFLYLHFVDSGERRYEFPFPEEDARMPEGNRTPSESTQNSYVVADAAEEAVDGASD
ncbi:UVR8 [Symbiodinium microadriaticum]|nr:UVR8 [Symbiodinium microadriaticum]